MSATKTALVFALLLCQAGAAQEKAAPRKLAPRASGDVLEGVLKDLDLTFKKETDKGGAQGYVFQRGDTRIRLLNYNGEDLWIEAVFDKPLTLAQANQWNVQAKYTRCVLLDNDGKATVSLEMQLDCIKGVTPGMIRQFLIHFGGELREFQIYAGKEKPKDKKSK
ncbi:MAG: YbjN domain-containing protein [Gemmataceae bacterium]